MHSVCCYNLLGWRSFWNVPPSLMDWPGWQFLFTFRPEKHKLGRGRWELAFCQVSLNSVQQFQRKSRKCLCQSEDRTAILFFWSAEKKRKPGRGCWDLASCQVCWILFSGFRGKVENLSANHRPGQPFCFPIHLKNTNLVENVEILLPIKFCRIPFSGFRGEVENVSANQRPGRSFCFSDWPEKHKLGRGRWDLASYQVLLNSVQRFQRRSRKCLGQSEARAAILFFRSARKTQTW